MYWAFYQALELEKGINLSSCPRNILSNGRDTCIRLSDFFNSNSSKNIFCNTASTTHIPAAVTETKISSMKLNRCDTSGIFYCVLLIWCFKITTCNLQFEKTQWINYSGKCCKDPKCRGVSKEGAASSLMWKASQRNDLCIGECFLFLEIRKLIRWVV